MKKIRVFLLLVLVSLVVPAFAQVGDIDFGDTSIPIMISADMLTYDRQNNIYTAEGNVEITRGGTVLKADTVTLHGDTNLAEASGNVFFSSGEDVLEADRVELNIDTQTGIIYNGMIFYADKHFYITGDEMEKMGEQTYRVLRGTLTSCDADVPAWKITGKKSEVTVEGYAEVWGGAFFVKDIPIAYIPYGIFPVKSKRQTGILFPAFGYSDRDGARFLESFFWAINKSTDATLTVDIMTKRGINTGLEYRYFLKKDLKGQVNATVIDDWIEDDMRWSFSFDHKQTLPGGIKTLWDINMISDDDYLDDLSDFYDNLPHPKSRYLESYISFWKEFYPVGIFLDASYFNDLDSKGDEITLHRAPRLLVYMRPLKVPGGIPLYIDMNPTFVNYYRDDGVRGQRLDINPTLTLPLHAGPLNLNTWFTGMWTGWWLTGDDTYPDDMDRTTFTAGTELSTYIGRTYDKKLGPFTSLRHIIKPTIAYTFSPDINQDDYPYFDTRDRVRGQSRLTLALENRLLGKRVTKDSGTVTRDLLYLELGVDIDFDPDDTWFGYDVTGTNISSYYEMRLRPSNYINVGFKASYDHEIEKFNRISSDISLEDMRGDTISVGYAYEPIFLNREPYEHIKGSLKLVVYEDLDFFMGARYSFDDDELRRINFGLDYRHQCWGLYLNVYSDEIPEDFGVMATFTLMGLGSVGTR